MPIFLIVTSALQGISLWCARLMLAGFSRTRISLVLAAYWATRNKAIERETFKQLDKIVKLTDIGWSGGSNGGAMYWRACGKLRYGSWSKDISTIFDHQSKEIAVQVLTNSKMATFIRENTSGWNAAKEIVKAAKIEKLNQALAGAPAFIAAFFLAPSSEANEVSECLAISEEGFLVINVSVKAEALLQAVAKTENLKTRNYTAFGAGNCYPNTTSCEDQQSRPIWELQDVNIIYRLSIANKPPGMSQDIYNEIRDWLNIQNPESIAAQISPVPSPSVLEKFQQDAEMWVMGLNNQAVFSQLTPNCISPNIQASINCGFGPYQFISESNTVQNIDSVLGASHLLIRELGSLDVESNISTNLTSACVDTPELEVEPSGGCGETCCPQPTCESLNLTYVHPDNSCSENNNSNYGRNEITVEAGEVDMNNLVLLQDLDCVECIECEDLNCEDYGEYNDVSDLSEGCTIGYPTQRPRMSKADPSRPCGLKKTCYIDKPALPVTVYKAGGLSFTKEGSDPMVTFCQGCGEVEVGQIISETGSGSSVTVTCSGGDTYSSVEATAKDACGRRVFYGNATSSSITVSYSQCALGAESSGGAGWCP